MLDAKRRAEIERLLLLRGHLLAPRKNVIDRSLRRCVKHAAQQAGDEWMPEGDDGGDETQAVGATSGTVGDHYPQGNLGSEELAPSPSEQLRIASEVAQAVTVSETDVDGSQMFGDPADNRKGLIPAIIKRGSTTVKGLAAGSIIKGYRIEGLLGIGGMGQVYRAQQMSMNRAVAFKILSPRLAKRADFRERFMREARNAGRLQHPHLIAVHDVDEADGLLFFSMELVDGQTVKQIIKAEGALAPERALGIARACLEGLSYAHAQGLVHRDIKPDNIMVTKAGQVKIADLGLSRLQEAADEASETHAGSLMGTPHYMAPEQSRNAHNVDHRADLYALGATLYHMLCGRVPFSGGNAMDILVRVATQPLTFPEPGPAPAIRDVIARLMEKSPSDRPASAREAIVLLDEGRSQAAKQAHDSRRLMTGRRQQTRRWMPWVIAAVLTIVVFAGALFAIKRGLEASEWSRLNTQIEEYREQQQYDQALQTLNDHAPDAPQRLQTTIARLRQDLTQEWNAHARASHEATLARIKDHLQAGRRRQARLLLLEIEQKTGLLSPWLEAQLPSLRQQLFSHQAEP